MLLLTAALYLLMKVEARLASAAIFALFLQEQNRQHPTVRKIITMVVYDSFSGVTSSSPTVKSSCWNQEPPLTSSPSQSLIIPALPFFGSS